MNLAAITLVSAMEIDTLEHDHMQVYVQIESTPKALDSGTRRLATPHESRFGGVHAVG